LTERPNSRAENQVVLACCAALSLTAIAWSFHQGVQLNYGDAIAHLHIARRVFDSRYPGITEFGSVWLPLPHLLMLPFVQVYAWWANGLAGTIPSALAWLAACAGIYRLARRWLAPTPSAVALIFFALNPNLLYLQTTAMTEPLFVCEMIWIVDGLVEWRNALADNDHKKLKRFEALIAIALVAAIYTRYDGWIMALLAWTAMGFELLRHKQIRSRSFWLWSALVIAAPLAWFIYNAAAFADWLYFARGPYSAKAIELRTAQSTAWPLHPGFHNPWVALLFYLKVTEMDAFALWRHFALALSAFGTVAAWFIARRRAFKWALLLWLPVPFYTYNVAYGWVPIFIPVWWPHSWYNTRYGMEMLPVLALGIGFIASFIIAAAREFKPRQTGYVTALLILLVALNAGILMRGRSLVFVESVKNSQARADFERDVPIALRGMLARCPGGTVLMNTSADPEFVTLTGIPLSQTINEADRHIYRDALAAPATHAALVLAFDGDEIDQAVRAHPEGLRAVAHFASQQQPAGTLYTSDSCPAPR
jgi:hypothetical protein